ncbi:MAG: CotH kinase family protein [Clostridia bacterium]|nr:CotH kinase family protein [Clostridia bacterium]
MAQNRILRLLCLLLILSFLLCICSCGEDVETPDTDLTETDEEKESESSMLSEATTEPKKYSVRYLETEGGRITGKLEQTVKEGKSGSRVEAIADEGYVFVAWSDGLTRTFRRDGPISEDLELYPIFELDSNYFAVKYVVTRGSKTILNETKVAKRGETVECKLPDPPFAYEFLGWSDGVVDTARVDNEESNGITYYAAYKPIYLDTPIISIDTEGSGGVTSKEHYKGCTVTLENADESYCFENVAAEIRGRGNSSWGMEKKSYRIKFSEKRSMFGSDYEAKSWTLIANHCDKSLSRNALAYEMSQRFTGLDFSSMNEFVELYLDGEYKGVYLLCDQIQVGEGRVDIGENFYDDPAQMGFLIELDARANEEGKAGYDYVELDYELPYLIKSPSSSDPAYDPDVHLKYVTNYLSSCLDALSEQDWDKICELIDIDSFVDMYIVNEMFANLDHYMFSCYFYKAPNGKLYAGPAWDFDISSGNVDYGYAEGSAESGPRQDLIYSGKLWIADRHTWYRRLLRNEEFVELLRKRLVGYKNEILSVAALADTATTDGYYARYGKAIERNFEKWKIMGVYLWPNPQVIVDITTAEGQMNYLADWLRERYYVLCEVYGIET